MPFALYLLVGLTGVEPVRPFERQILSLVRLPIPPQPPIKDIWLSGY